jgi:hypothetical protein
VIGKFTEVATLGAALISPNDCVAHLPYFELDEDGWKQTFHGLDLKIDPQKATSWKDGSAVRLISSGKLIAVAKFNQRDGILHPAVVLG